MTMNKYSLVTTIFNIYTKLQKKMTQVNSVVCSEYGTRYRGASGIGGTMNPERSDESDLKWRRSILSKEIRHTEFKISTEISSSRRMSWDNRLTRLFGMMIILNFQLTNMNTVQSCFKWRPYQVPIPSHRWFLGKIFRFQTIKKC